MIFVPILVLLVVAGAAALVRLALRADHEPDRDPAEEGVLGTRSIGPLGIVGIAIGALIVLSMVVPMLGVGLRRGMGDEEVEQPGEPSTPAEEANVPAVRREPPRDTIQVDIHVAGTDSFSLTPRSVVGNIATGDVVVVRATGFPADTTGDIDLCVRDDCRSRFPVRFDSDGVALIQYELDVGGSSCQIVGDCRLVIRAHDVRGTAEVLAGPPPPSPTARVVAGAAVRPDDPITVEVAGAGPEVDILLCPVDAASRTDCKARAPARSRTPGMPAIAQFDRAPAGAGIALVVDRASGAVLSEPARFHLAARAGPRYSAARLAAGFAVALAALAIATVLIRRTDWTEPNEASTPAFDTVAL